jgi:hypothetical protein
MNTSTNKTVAPNKLNLFFLGQDLRRVKQREIAEELQRGVRNREQIFESLNTVITFKY